MKFRNSLAAITLLIAAPAAAEEAGSYIRALAAGYKAQFVCSGVFNAGRTIARTEADELVGIYPELQPLLGELAAKIDPAAKSVSVGFDPGLPPRIAAWRPGLGCTGLPIGADPANARHLPRLPLSPPRHIREADWPDGDAGAAAKPKSSSRGLGAALTAAFDDKTYGAANTTATVVVARGKIVAERYKDGFGPYISQRTWSVAKSLSGTLIGVAVRQGLIDVDAPAPVPEWRTPGDPRAAITTGQLLRMASGLHSDSAGNRTDAVYFGGTSFTESLPGLPLEAKPGTRFRYANNDTLLAVRGLRAAIGDDSRYLAFPFSALFWKIGMTNTFAETDWQGNFILSSQVWTTARDLARLGMLYLNDGVWNGERILPEGWVKSVSAPSGPQPDGPFGYGATFWLLNRSEGVPPDTFAAFGNRGQYVVIVPSRQIVIVRRGEDTSGNRFDIARFTADILAALK